MEQAKRILLVDLNNFARYPTLPIGYMAAILRADALQVEVFSPLMVGVGGVVREKRPHRLGLLVSKLNHRAATSSQAWVRRWRQRVADGRVSDLAAHHDKVVEGFARSLASAKPDGVLISTYLMYRPVCERICALCLEAGVPVLIGGPYFSQPEVIRAWMGMAGLSALAAGEVELDLPQIVRTLIQGGDVSHYPGIISTDAQGAVRGDVAPPLRRLDAVPFPDYKDFPWGAYPNRIAPIVTGRGCGWGVCTFCSDVTSTAGRSFRSRSPANVLEEMAHHHRRLDVSRFVFTDLKLNSDLTMWRSLVDKVQSTVPGAEWIGAVHVGTGDNGLSARELRQAAASGCVRLTTGFETGSEHVADLMKKGARREAVGQFLQDAASAGISTRCTMITGYPGERAQDVHASAAFLELHHDAIERVSLNRLNVVMGTTLHRRLQAQPERFRGVTVLSQDPAMAQVEHHNLETQSAEHRQAMSRLLTVVHRINRKPLLQRAREFEGVM
jgi:anaerobic magnesium-protoporphyrin IX monomethyl ester cyclase